MPLSSRLEGQLQSFPFSKIFNFPTVKIQVGNPTMLFDIVQSPEKMGEPVCGAFIVKEEVSHSGEIALQQRMTRLNKFAVTTSMSAKSPQERIPRESVQVEKACSPPEEPSLLHQPWRLAV